MMEVELRRRYQHSLSQLAEALPAACRNCYPRLELDGQSSISLDFHTRRPGFPGGGEKVSLLICPPGQVIIRSRYLGQAPLISFGNNEANVRRLAESLDGYCAKLPPACFYCGTLAQAGAQRCANCSMPLADDSARPQVRLPQVRSHVAALLWTGLSLGALLCTLALLLYSSLPRILGLE